jgi:peroxiredoxin
LKKGDIATQMPDAMLQRGSSAPHFEVTTIQGEELSYSTIWQRRNLVLVALPASDPGLSEGYVSELMARAAEFRFANTACVLTRDRVPGMREGSVIVADNWGEIAYVASASHLDELPSAEELLDWVDYLERRCPECEGESR